MHHPKKLPLKILKRLVTFSPIIAIDLIVKYKDKYLLGLRVNKPAKNYYFVPGGRIRKNETIPRAFQRILKDETEIRQKLKKLFPDKIGEHFYKNSFFSQRVKTHYITFCFIVSSYKPFTPKRSQHKKWIWLKRGEILSHPRVHPYAKDYFRRL